MVEDPPVVPGLLPAGGTGPFQGVGVCQVGQVVKAGAHVQGEAVPAEGQVHRTAGGVRGGAVGTADRFGYKVVQEGGELRLGDVGPFLEELGPEIVIDAPLDTEGAESVKNQEGIATGQAVRRLGQLAGHGLPEKALLQSTGKALAEIGSVIGDPPGENGGGGKTLPAGCGGRHRGPVLGGRGWDGGEKGWGEGHTT